MGIALPIISVDGIVNYYELIGLYTEGKNQQGS